MIIGYLPKMAENETTETKPTEETSPAIKFSFTPVEEKPSRKYRKGSKYDPILDSFLKGKDKLSEVTVTGKDANYLRTQLNKRIESSKKYSRISVSVVNNKIYLQKK